MRIRKRFLPTSLSSLPLSDPQLIRSPVVQQDLRACAQVHPDGKLEGISNSQPSDPPNLPSPPPASSHPTIGRERTRWVASDSSKTGAAKQKEVEGEEEGKSNDTRKGSILGAEVGTGLLPPPGTSSDQEPRWDAGDRTVPLKKRKASFERASDGDREKRVVKARMKSKTNKKLVQLEDGIEAKEAKEGSTDQSNNGGMKKVKRGNVIMEGSRCSRVNGRGWRCCQQTLVGYSLCEHHLGKGRLRSMTSVRSRAVAPNSNINISTMKKEESEVLFKHSDLLHQSGEDDEEEERKPLMSTKKKLKLGVVKARSISSLLGQTNNAVAVADTGKNSSL